MRSILLAAAVGLPFAAPAAAQELLYGLTAMELQSILQEYGADATLDKSDSGALMVYGTTPEGYSFDAFLYSCDEAKVPSCIDVQYRSILPGGGKAATIATTNNYNNERAFGRAYINPEGAPVVEHMFSLEGGISREAVGASFAFFTSVVTEFEAYINQ